MKAAVEAADLDSFMATLSSEAVLRSPISTRAEFRGTAEMRRLMRAVFDTIEDIRYFEDLGDDQARAVFYRARIGPQTIEESGLLRFDDDGLIREITLWIRPMPGITRLAATLAPRMARERSRLGAGLVAAATRPLAWLTSIGDKLLIGLIRPKHAGRNHPDDV